MNIIRKRQIRWVAKDDIIGQIQFVRAHSRNRSLIPSSIQHPHWHTHATLFATLPKSLLRKESRRSVRRLAENVHVKRAADHSDSKLRASNGLLRLQTNQQAA